MLVKIETAIQENEGKKKKPNTNTLEEYQWIQVYNFSVLFAPTFFSVLTKAVLLK